MQSVSACAVGSLSKLCFHSINNLTTNDIFPLQCSSSYGTFNSNNLSSFFKKHENNRYPFQTMQINSCASDKTEQVLVDMDSSLSPPPAPSPSPEPALAPKPDPNMLSWELARSYKKKGATFRCKVKGTKKGGLLVHFSTLVGFVPYPELSASHYCKEPTLFKKKVVRGLIGYCIYLKFYHVHLYKVKHVHGTIDTKGKGIFRVFGPEILVIEVDQEKGLLVFSNKDACWSKFSRKVNVGEIYDGKVGNVESCHAFVHLRSPGGQYYLTGLVHVSEVSWDFVQDAREVLREGDDVRVKVLQIDREKQKIILSIKQLEENPHFETLHKVFMEKLNGAAVLYSDSTSGSVDIQPLPGLQEIINELLKEKGITGVRISRQGFEKGVLSQDLQLWFSNAPSINNSSIIHARAGRQVQDIQLTTSLDQEGIKKALQRVLERVP